MFWLREFRVFKIEIYLVCVLKVKCISFLEVLREILIIVVLEDIVDVFFFWRGFGWDVTI